MNKIQLMVLMLILGAILLSGCVGKSISETTLTPVPTAISTPKPTISPEPTPIPTIINDDTKFIDLIVESSDILSTNADGLINALIVQNYDNIELYGKYLRDDSQNYFKELNTLKVSEKLKPAFEEYNQSLITYHSVADVAASGTVRTYNSYGRSGLIDNVNTGAAHNLRALQIIKTIF